MIGKFRYQASGKWLKGNTHIHSIVSDGALNFQQLANLYGKTGYDFLCRTDHWIASNANGDAQPGGMVWLDGIEVDERDEAGSYYHVVCLGKFEKITRTMRLDQAVQAAREQGGLAILAHPHWTGNTFDEALRYTFDGVEVYNNVCQWMNGKGFGGAYWDAMLAYNPATLAFASDDAHLTSNDPSWNGGWIMVNAAERKAGPILEAIRAGNFYASTGPEFLSLQADGQRVKVETSPVRAIRLVGPKYLCHKFLATEGETISSAEFDVPESWAGAYIQIEDEARRMAWSNPLFIS
jgi:hypothetical protein